MQDFFAQQDRAKKLSTRLVLTLALACLGTVLATGVALAALVALISMAHIRLTTRIPVDPQFWHDLLVTRGWLAFAVPAILVVGVAIAKTRQYLEGGGVELANQLGGTRIWTDTRQHKHRQLLNIVEEMAVATQLPVPKIFLLNKEPGINAFAAGINSRDTVVAVTQGALDLLDRSQLQAIIAHEFAHIVHGDVRINVQTLGVVHGIEAITSLAGNLMRLGVSNLHGSPIAAIFGYVLWPIGKIGGFFGTLAKMALNRQREFLADAAAVQFTRNPAALSSALKLLASRTQAGLIQAGTAQLASHLFFVEGTTGFANLLRSHPTLEERIRRLERDWDGKSPEQLPADPASSLHNEDPAVLV